MLYLVIGGETVTPERFEFRDLTTVDLVGVYPDKATATFAWRGKAQGSVDNALMRYFIVQLTT